MKVISTSFSMYGSDNYGRHVTSLGNGFTTTNATLREHFYHLRKTLFKHAEDALKQGAPGTSEYTINVCIVNDTAKTKIRYVNFKKNILHVVENYQHINKKIKEKFPDIDIDERLER